MKALVRSLALLRVPAVTWVEDSLAVGRFPSERALRALAARRVTLVVNLHERPHHAGLLAELGIRELHLPVRDFHAPTASTLDRAVDAVEEALGRGERVMVHCGAGFGRTGTVVACLFVARGLGAAGGIARARALRPGSIETVEQQQAVRRFEKSRKPGDTVP